MWTTSFSRSIRGNQHCINLKSRLGSPASFVPNQLQKYNIRDVRNWSKKKLDLKRKRNFHAALLSKCLKFEAHDLRVLCKLFALSPHPEIVL